MCVRYWDEVGFDVYFGIYCWGCLIVVCVVGDVDW